MLYDGQDRFFELRLPLDLPNYHTRRHGLPSSFYDLTRAQSEIDLLAQHTKTRVRELVPDVLPEELEWLNNSPAWDRVRQGGLRSLLDTLKRCEIAPEAVAVLEAWKRNNDRLLSRWIALRDRLIAHRRWVYRNLAAWLMSNYSEIALEGPLGIAKMLRLPPKDPALKLARRYHRWSAVGEFVRFVKEAAAKTATTVVEIAPAMTTLPCNERGALAKGGPEQILECPNGHRWD
jgi:hypothetical protein